MNFNLTGRHIEITPAIRDYVSSKIGRVSRHFDHVIDAHVILSVDKLRQKAEVTLHVRGKDIHCECEDPDMYAAIDLLADKLDRQVLKYKDKRYAKPMTKTWNGPNGPVEVKVLYHPEYASNAEPVLQATIDSLKYFSDTLGGYPYKSVTAVIPPYGADEAGGMEYPTFFTADSTRQDAPGTPGRFALDFVTVHEFGHGYFYGILASNEFEEPWLDEGMNEYWDQRMMTSRKQDIVLTNPWLKPFGIATRVIVCAGMLSSRSDSGERRRVGLPLGRREHVRDRRIAGGAPEAALGGQLDALADEGDLDRHDQGGPTDDLLGVDVVGQRQVEVDSDRDQPEHRHLAADQREVEREVVPIELESPRPGIDVAEQTEPVELLPEHRRAGPGRHRLQDLVDAHDAGDLEVALARQRRLQQRVGEAPLLLVQLAEGDSFAAEDRRRQVAPGSALRVIEREARLPRQLGAEAFAELERGLACGVGRKGLGRLGRHRGLAGEAA